MIMSKLVKRFFGLNVWVKAVFFFCLLGTFANIFLLCRDISSGGILFRLHAGFFILYASQTVFILLNERYAGVLTVLQGVLALLTSADFMFAPLMRVLGQFYYLVNPTPSVEAMKVYKYVFISLCFTLQMLAAYVLFSLLPKPPKKKPEEASAA